MKHFLALAALLLSASAMAQVPVAVLGATDCPKNYIKTKSTRASNKYQTYACIRPGTQEAYDVGQLIPIKEMYLEDDGTPAIVIDLSTDANSYGLNEFRKALSFFPEEQMPRYVEIDPNITLSFDGGEVVSIEAHPQGAEYRFDLSEAPEFVEYSAQEPQYRYRHRQKLSFKQGFSIESWRIYQGLGFGMMRTLAPGKEGVLCKDSAHQTSAELRWTFATPDGQTKAGATRFRDASIELEVNGKEIIPLQSKVSDYDFDFSSYENARTFFKPARLHTKNDVALDAAFDCFDHLAWRALRENKPKPNSSDLYDLELIRAELNDAR